MKKVHKAYKKRNTHDLVRYGQELAETAQEIYMLVIESEHCEQINIDYGGGAVLFDGDNPIAKIDYQGTTRYYCDHTLPRSVEPLAAIERFIRKGELDDKWLGNVDDFDPQHTVVVGSRFPNS